MSRGLKLYAVMLAAGIAFLAGTELLPRRHRGFGYTDLRRVISGLGDDLYAQEERQLAGSTVDEADLDRMRVLMLGMRRELILRDSQTVIVLVLFVASFVPLISGLRRANRTQSLRSGHVDVVEDVEVRISDEQLPAELSKLQPSRKLAILSLRDGPRLRCGYCRARIRMETLGRIGRRIFHRRPPEGAKDLNLVIGEGWWFVRVPPPACPKCHSENPHLA